MTDVAIALHPFFVFDFKCFEILKGKYLMNNLFCALFCLTLHRNKKSGS